MKRFKMAVWAGAIFLLTLTAVSADAPVDGTPCEIFSWTAGKVMAARQAGMLMNEQMKFLETHLPPGTQGRESVRLMILQAYESPLFQTQAIKERTIREFQNKWYLQCERAGWQNLK